MAYCSCNMGVASHAFTYYAFGIKSATSKRECEEIVALVELGLLVNAAGYRWQANSTIAQHQNFAR